MKLTFLGGADEVGASCTLVEIGGRRIVVDCGVRTGSDPADSLPSLAELQGLEGGLDAIILTHAHLDHTGALGVLCPFFPLVPVYMTPATLQMSSVMLQDALKVMAIQCKQLGTVPLYGPEAIERVFANARAVPMGQVVELFGGEVRMQFGPAGHILGAAWCLLEAEDGTALMTGDISITEQMTIPGMMVPNAQPDVVVVESTYGGRLHANRTAEHRRLIEQVKEVIEDGGNVLFPAFAVGRAQEVILILAQAMEKKLLPEVPVYVDGLVRDICRVYSAHPDLATSWFRKRIERFTNPFFISGGPVQPVNNPKDRETLPLQGPAIFVSSSGMLTGGPSQLYARLLAAQPKSLIAITGYQDEESPGRHIQNLARQGGGKLKIGEESVELTCKVATYSLSAHADTAQIVGLMSALRPKHIALVHGDAGARQALQQALQQAGHPIVHLPTLGASIALRGKPGRTLQRRASPLATPLSPNDPNAEPTLPPLTLQDLPPVAAALRGRDGLDMTYTVQDVLFTAQRLQEALDEDAIAHTLDLLLDPASPFKRDKLRPYLFRVRANIAPALAPTTPTAAAPPLSKKAQRAALARQSQELFDVLQRTFADDTTYYGRHVMMPQRRMELHFHFPEPAKARHATRLQLLAAETGWNFTIRDTPHHQALQQAAVEALPSGWSTAGIPRLLHDQAVVVLPILAADLALEPLRADEAALAFRARTGFQLLFDPLQHLPLADTPPEPTRRRPHTTPTPTPTDPRAPDPLDEAALPVLAPARLEFNRARAAILHAFDGHPHEVYKVSQHGETLELSFISPQIGRRYTFLLRELEQLTGWPLRIRDQSDQKRIPDKLTALLPTNTLLAQLPSFHPALALLRVRLKRPLPPAARATIEATFLEATGFRIQWDG